MSTRTISKSIDLKNQVSKDFVNNNSQATVNKYITQISDGGIKVHDVDGSNYIQITADGLTVNDDTGAPMARFTKTEAQIGRDNENRLNLTAIGESLVSDENVKWFEIKKSGKTVSDTYEYWESCRNETTFTLTKTPVAQCNIAIQIRLNLDTQVEYDGWIESTAYARHTFIQGTTSSVQLNPVSGGTPSNAASNSYCTATYDSTNNSITVSGLGSNVTSAGFYTIIYMAQSEAVDLGDFIFGTRGPDSYYTSENATGTVSIGRGLVAIDPYQVVIGKYNDDYDSRNQLFVIGNGVETHPNNVFSVDENGKVTASGGFRSPFFTAIANGSASYIYMNGDVDVKGNIISGISACGAVGTADMALTQSEQKINLTTNRGKTVGYLINNDGGIKCLKDGYIEVSAGAYFTSGFTAGDLVHLIIKKNSTNIINAVHKLSGNYDVYSIAPIVYSVSQGDILYLYAYNQTGARGKVNAAVNSWLTVKYL